FASTSVYKDFDFTDFKLLTKSVGLYRTDVSDRALILRSASFGSPARLRLSVRYPEQPGQTDIIVSHLLNFINNETQLNLIASLASDNEILAAAIISGSYSVSASANGNLFDWRISHPTINSGSEYVLGNILNIESGALAGSYKITD